MQRPRLNCNKEGHIIMLSVYSIFFMALSTVASESSPIGHNSSMTSPEMARWIVHNANWGFLTKHVISTDNLEAEVLSFSDGAELSLGRVFFYMMEADMDKQPAAFTISEASLNSTCGDLRQWHLDPEDPRCARITLSGIVKRLVGADADLGRQALFARHPQMEMWPKGHHFQVFELQLHDIWMIDFYGGGQLVEVSAFLAAEPKHSVPHQGHAHSIMHAKSGAPVPVPPWNRTAARARWLVYHSLWGSIGTNSVRLGGLPWGNVRSVTDGVGKTSTGLPVLYLPSVDPSGQDIERDSRASISMSEAALTERMDPTKGSCGGMDPEDPTCARITLSGHLRALTDPAEISAAEQSMRVRHPLAPWLVKVRYYKLELDDIDFLDFYGGPASLNVTQYLAVPPEEYLIPNHVQTLHDESFCQTVADNHGCCPACGYSWSTSQGKCLTELPAKSLYCKFLEWPSQKGCCRYCGHWWSDEEERCVGGSNMQQDIIV
eukprot:TRINITY_DN92025_c0_g1_i1.p1 TRINITY_DN92025_c0_g1~~TRINITY_DN92025_c0_g1_i1.p1  ORF type:complete len:491 (+),score=62.64 TRINITY_DN92025_c0_g1_i1:15-1487(+)